MFHSFQTTKKKEVNLRSYFKGADNWYHLFLKTADKLGNHLKNCADSTIMKLG